MRLLALISLLLWRLISGAQDRVYLSSGEMREGKIELVAPDYLIMVHNGLKTEIPVSDVVLIRLENQEHKVYNLPSKDMTFYRDKSDSISVIERDRNLVAFNALALANADLAFSFERLSKDKKFGVGAYGGYNFNTVVILNNSYLQILPNCKKHGDLGVFINRYRRQFKKRRTFYFGIMLKYSPISYSSVTENRIVTGNTTSTSFNFKPARGSQVSFLFSIGNHRQINSHLFIRSQVGVGYFNLRGEMKDQYNYHANKLLRDPVVFSTLPKMFAGIYIGYRF